MTVIDPFTYLARRLPIDELDGLRGFWEHFEEHADDLHEMFTSGSDVRRAAGIMEPLSEIAPGLAWEFGPSPDGHRLAISAEWNADLRVLARAALDLAPNLPGWSFSDLRDGRDPEALAINFENRFGMPLVLSRIECAPGAGNRVTMTGHGKGSGEMLGNQMLGVASYLLGEEADRDWFGDVEPVPAKRGFLGFGKGPDLPEFDPDAFVSAFDVAVDMIRAGLPKVRYARRDIELSEATLYQLDGAHPDCGRPDLYFFSAPDDAYAEAAVMTARFASVNHSRHDEWFLYVRISRSDAHPFDDAGDRHAIEAKAHEILSGHGIGGLVGGGQGGDAVYVDVATTDPAAALDALADGLAGEGWADETSFHFLEAGLPAHGLTLREIERKPH